MMLPLALTRLSTQGTPVIEIPLVQENIASPKVTLVPEERLKGDHSFGDLVGGRDQIS